MSKISEKIAIEADRLEKSIKLTESAKKVAENTIKQNELSKAFKKLRS